MCALESKEILTSSLTGSGQDAESWHKLYCVCFLRSTAGARPTRWSAFSPCDTITGNILSKLDFHLHMRVESVRKRKHVICLWSYSCCSFIFHKQMKLVMFFSKYLSDNFSQQPICWEFLRTPYTRTQRAWICQSQPWWNVCLLPVFFLSYLKMKLIWGFDKSILSRLKLSRCTRSSVVTERWERQNLIAKLFPVGVKPIKRDLEHLQQIAYQKQTPEEIRAQNESTRNTRFSHKKGSLMVQQGTVY